GAAGAVNNTGVLASFNGPNDVAADASGNLFVADNVNNLIREIVISTGVVTTFAGSTQGYVDATGVLAKFNHLSGISIDLAGNLYVADQGNDRIRMVTPAGVVTTVAGSGAAAETNATGVVAAFSTPIGINVDGLGNCFTVDAPTGTTGTVRQIVVTGYTISVAVPAGLTFTGTTGVVSGTPTVTSAATNYTITGWNASGSSSTVVSIAVGQTVAWKGGTNRKWATGTNWSTGGAPGVNDAVTIGVSAYTGANEPKIITVVSVGSVTFGNTGGNHNLTLTGGSLTVGSYLTVNTGTTATLSGTGSVNISPGAI